MRQRTPRQKDSGHLAYLRQLPCCICLDHTSTEAAHIRFTEPKVAKENPGMQQKPDDRFAVPLCGRHHREQHSGNERAWWNGYKIDPHFLALALHNASGDTERGEAIIRAHGHH
jgi:hypothetical protein